MFCIRTALLTIALLASVPITAQKASDRPLGPGDKTRFPAPADVAAPPEDARRTESGLAWRLLGEPAEKVDRPGPQDSVAVRYTGWKTDGELFDTTEVTEQPRTFFVGGAIPGFQEAIQLLSVGERGRFWVPEDLAYGNAKGKPSGMLVFDLTLVRINRGPERPAHLEAPPENAERLESGLAWIVLEEGAAGQQPPGADSTVLVQYSGWTTDGELMDSSAHRGEPRAFTMDMVIEGFRQTFGTMVPGERRLVWIPPELTELEGRRTVEETTVFDIELISYMTPPQTPASVSTIPDDAERSPTGLAWRVLKKGSGEVHPKAGDTVEVLYAMWTADGELFDSSYAHARPGKFALNDNLPAGFNEALFAMVTGEKRMIWIPKELAYGDRKDRPVGMLVFEIELLTIEPQ